MILTDRLHIRPFQPTDGARVARLYQDNPHHLGDWLPLDNRLLLSDDFWQLAAPELAKRQDNGKEMRFFITWAHDLNGPILGYLSLTRIDHQNRSCEISFGIGQRFTRQGIASEAVRGAMKYASDTLGIDRIDANHAVQNVASCELLSRLGYTRIGVAPAFRWVNGEWADYVLRTWISKDRREDRELPLPPELAAFLNSR